jgi:dethiobiotin synthetase
MSSRAFFITGTDTDIGKTLVAEALLAAANACGWSSLGLKPVSAGCEQHQGEWQNEDAIRLRARSSLQIPYAQTNPLALVPAIAPHIALAEAGRSVSVGQLAQQCREVLQSRQPDFAVVEGAGGWLVPLNAQEDMAQLAVAMGLPVILVVGLRLGCLNHALLTANAIRASGLHLAGWVGTSPGEPMQRLAENVATLHARLPAPGLGELPPLGEVPSIEAAAACLDLEPLLATKQ